MRAANGGAILPLARLPSGITGLDTLLQGGFPKGGINIIEGAPGSGKTILGNQLCHHHVRRGGRAIYVTLLAENHARMLLHMGQFRFFEPSNIPDRIYLISGFRVLEESGIQGLLDLLRREVRRHSASVVVIDGMAAVDESSSTPRDYKKFLHQLQAIATLAECTVFLLTGSAAAAPSPEHTMVDGVIELQSSLVGPRLERSLIIHKMRGAAMNGGRHAMRISDAGLLVYPRVESHAPVRTSSNAAGEIVSTGIPSLDVLLGGGVHAGSTTLVVGPPGIGKTTVGLQFLAPCTPQDQGVFLGLYETQACLQVKAEMLGLPAAQQLGSGAIEMLWHPTTEAVVDELCDQVLTVARQRRARRVVIDGLGGLHAVMANPARLSRILAALSVELQVLGAVSLFLAECATDDARRALPLTELSLHGVSAVAQNIVLMRYLDDRRGTYRALAAIKCRNSPIDLHMHRFTIGKGGITVNAKRDGVGDAIHQPRVRRSASSTRTGRTSPRN